MIAPRTYPDALFACEEGPYEAPTAPAEEDLVTEDCRRFYSDGRLAFVVTEDEDLGDAIRTWMAEEGFYPDVWLLDDHGGATPLEY